MQTTNREIFLPTLLPAITDSEQRVTAAWRKNATERVQAWTGGCCPCCGQEEAHLSDVTLIIGRADHTGQVALIPHHLCRDCAQLDAERRLALSLVRPLPPMTVPYMVLSLLVTASQPIKHIAEQVAAHFPSVTNTLIMGVVEGQIAIILSQLTPTQFTWINRLIAQNIILAVGVSLISATRPGRYEGGQLLRSRSDLQRRSPL